MRRYACLCPLLTAHAMSGGVLVSLGPMQSDTFVPAWWLPGPHMQTLGARLLRSRRGIAFDRERVELDDGDFVDLDWAHPEGVAGLRDETQRPLALVLHGLEGSARSKYAIGAYRGLLARGIAPVGLNFRSCSGELNRGARLYHSGETTDLGFVLETLRARYPGRPLAAIGFSLGGNVLLKYLGEHAGSGAAMPEVAVAISVPFDLSAGADHIERGVSKVYLWFLLRKLKRKVRGKQAVLRSRMDIAGALRARGFRDFDDAATAPLHRFENAEDYYTRSSSSRYLSAIRVRTLLIQSEDDPFLPARAIPRDAADANPNIHSRIVPRGGHVGFVSGPAWAPRYWAEERAAQFVSDYLENHKRHA